MKAASLKIRLVHTLVLLPLVGLTQVANAQVGIHSGVAQVTLVARSNPQGSIDALGTARQIRRTGTMVEASMLVRGSANTGYRLLVRGGLPTYRVWVQDVNGEYQELTGASAVTIAQDQQGAGEWEREVRYRVEIPENGELAGPLPVRYDIAIKPTI